MELKTPQVLYSQETIAQRVQVMGQEISRDHAGVDSLLLVGVLRGAYIFLADLARQISMPCGVDFVALSTYDGSSSAGRVRVILDLRTNIESRHVLIVEDIVDNGDTLVHLQHMLRLHNPASLKTCTLLRKLRPRTIDPPVDYVGFETDTPNWIVGYGLDLDDHYRALPYVGTLDLS